MKWILSLLTMPVWMLRICNTRWWKPQKPSDVILKHKSKLTRKIVRRIKGATKRADQIAGAFAKGRIRIHYMNKPGFRARAKKLYPGWFGWWHRTGLEAWAYGNDIFINSDSDKLYDNLVHEGEHALRWLEYNESPTKFREEWEVRKVVREFRIAQGREAWSDYLDDCMDMLGYL